MEDKTPEREGTCSICNNFYSNCGNNADPFPGRCCDDCNKSHVIPARIAGITKEEAEHMLKEWGA